MAERNVEGRIMKGLAGVRGIAAVELQARIIDEQDLHIPFATLNPALDRLVERGQVTMVEGEPNERGFRRRFYSRTLRIVA